MKHSSAADRFARNRFLKQECILRTAKAIRSNSFFAPVKRAQAGKSMFFLLPYTTRLHNYCYLTSRSRGILREFGLSRFSLKQLVGFRLVNGVKRSSW